MNESNNTARERATPTLMHVVGLLFIAGWVSVARALGEGQRTAAETLRVLRDWFAGDAALSAGDAACVEALEALARIGSAAPASACEPTSSAPTLTEDERAALRRRGWPEEDGGRVFRSPGKDGPKWYATSPDHLRHLREVARSLMAERDTVHEATSVDASSAQRGWVCRLPVNTTPEQAKFIAADALAVSAEVKAAIARGERERSGPTARDAAAGMLLRHGLDGWANALVRGASPADVAKQLGPASPVDCVSPKHAACIAALEALDRGELRVERGPNPAAPDELARNATRWRDKFARAERTLQDAGDALGMPRASDYSDLPQVVRERMDEARARVAKLQKRSNEMRDGNVRLDEAAELLTRERDQALRMADGMAKVAGIANREASEARAELDRARVYVGARDGEALIAAIKRVGEETADIAATCTAQERDTAYQRGQEDMLSRVRRLVTQQIDASEAGGEYAAARLRDLGAELSRIAAAKTPTVSASEVTGEAIPGAEATETAGAGQNVARGAGDAAEIARLRAELDAVKLSRDKTRNGRSKAEDALKEIEDVLLSAGTTPQSNESLADTVRRALEGRGLVAPKMECVDHAPLVGDRVVFLFSGGGEEPGLIRRVREDGKYDLWTTSAGQPFVYGVDRSRFRLWD